MKQRPKGRPITEVDNELDQKETLRFRLFIASVIAYIVYGLTRPDIIGSDIRYAIFIILLPLLAGMWILGFRPASISKIWNNAENLGDELKPIVVHILLYLVASFFSFGLLGKIVWDTTNRIIVKDKQMEIKQCPIIEFGAHGKSRSTKHVEFEFNNISEQINISSDTMLLYEDKNPTNYNILLETKEGLWNHYLVLGYSIQHK